MATVFMRNVEPHFWAELKGACPSNVGTWASSESEEGGGVLCWNISDLYIFTHIYIKIRQIYIISVLFYS